MPRTFDTKPRILRAGPVILVVESVFWHAQRYPRRRVAPHRPPLVETATAREVEDPYRTGEAVALRVPLTRRALVFGFWKPADVPVTSDEETGKLLEAIDGVMIQGITATEISGWAKAADTWWTELRTKLIAWWDGFKNKPVYADAVAPPTDETEDWAVTDHRNTETWVAAGEPELPPNDEVIDLTQGFR